MENDINIINLVKKGDVRAFDILVVKYQDRLVYSVFKFCKDFELSQDIAQKLLLKLSEILINLEERVLSTPGFTELLSIQQKIIFQINPEELKLTMKTFLMALYLICL